MYNVKQQENILDKVSNRALVVEINTSKAKIEIKCKPKPTESRHDKTNKISVED